MQPGRRLDLGKLLGGQRLHERGGTLNLARDPSYFKNHPGGQETSEREKRVKALDSPSRFA
jgi:hypothetical protein